MNNIFRKISVKISNATGKASTFVSAFLIVLLWAAVGPVFGFSDTWQLVINTGTTIITFLMVFLIQNTQNRDSKSIHLKLDELIRTQKSANVSFLDLDSKSDQELEGLAERFTNMSQKVVGKEIERKQKKVSRYRLLGRGRSEYKKLKASQAKNK